MLQENRAVASVLGIPRWEIDLVLNCSIPAAGGNSGLA